MLQNAMVAAFTVSELFRENQQGVKLPTPPPHPSATQIRVKGHFKNHSTKKIKEHSNSKELFTFREFQETEIIKTIKELPQKLMT